MSAIKRFFEKKKIDSKFKQAGSGHKLNEARHQPVASSSKPVARQQQTSSASRAGEAALLRLQSQQQQPKKPSSNTATWKHQTSSCTGTEIDYDKMKQEMSSERKKSLQNDQQPKQSSINQKLAVEGINFICPVCPASLSKPELYDHLEECFSKDLEMEPLMISVAMIHTLNEDRAKVENCIHILGKYLQNIIDHGEEEKYCKIRTGNKVFSEKVASLRGVKEFLLKGCGFELKMMPFLLDGETTEQEFYVLNEKLASNSEQLTVTKQMLNDAEPLEMLLDRNMKVYEPSSSANRIEVPKSFYSVTTSELKREHNERTRDTEQMKQLRTKAMRDADNNATKKAYKFTVLRIRFPDGVLIQGTFRCSETLSEVKEFIKENMNLDWLPFTLCDSIGKPFPTDTVSLSSLKLTPAALLTFVIEETMREEIASSTSDGKIQYLCDECLVLIQSLKIGN